ncbi:hypothetical protein GCM10009678_63110 [Actinomadura kijaniata]|uniref:Regulatory protein n=1 Tax=Actinomadura namibiensis TaxID=182080 RepID=A0A7W3LWR6_ACTNM|nr:hypothetical protein [Actinomadura namibiensis]MBA8955686.1 hypothetical protein [Actinomadura namibiensis]
MRNIPVDVTGLTFVCVAPPRPKLVSQETGEVKVDRDGNAVFTVGLSAADQMGRIDLLSVALSKDPGITLGQVVRVVGLVAMPWERQMNGRLRWGIAYRADDIVVATLAAVPPAGTSTDAA